MAREQTERMVENLVDARVFIEMNLAQDRVREEWEKALEDVKIIEKAARKGVDRFLFKL